MSAGHHGGTRGFTLVELLLALALLALVASQAFSLMQMATWTQSREMSSITVEDQARRVLERAAFAIMGADRDKLFPEAESPVDASDLRYEVSLGVEAGEIVWGEPQRIGLGGTPSQLSWSERPEAEDERRVVWCNIVRPFLAGEIENGLDDNANGLVDERGISFELEGDQVTLRLTLESPNADGEPILRTVETVVTCRN